MNAGIGTEPKTVPLCQYALHALKHPEKGPFKNRGRQLIQRGQQCSRGRVLQT